MDSASYDTGDSARNPFSDYHLKPEGAEMGYQVEPGYNDIPYHTWWIKGGGNGVHIWARQCKSTQWGDEWIGGVECHFGTAPGWCDQSTPHHDKCWLIERPCWHDGSSLYFSERIAPRLPFAGSDTANDFNQMPHSLIGFELVDWFRDKFSTEQAA